MAAIERIFGGRRQPTQNLRIVITRHGERADQALGRYWWKRMQYGGQNSLIPRLPKRDKFDEWDVDPSLTVNGEHQATNVGRRLRGICCPIDYCYSSPAYRSIQTANKILESQGRRAVPINIEPGTNINE